MSGGRSWALGCTQVSESISHPGSFQQVCLKVLATQLEVSCWPRRMVSSSLRQKTNFLSHSRYINLKKVLQMRLGTFNLMRCSSDHYVFIKKPGQIILSFAQQAGIKTIANILILIYLLLWNLLSYTTWRSH